MSSQQRSTQSSEPDSKRQIHYLGQYGTSLLNAVAKGVERELVGTELTMIDFGMMRMFLTDEEWTATELAQVLPREAPAISRRVNKMVQMGILSRRRSRSDRRVVHLRLTEEGKALTLDINRKVTAYEEKLVEGIPEEEVENLKVAAEKIFANFDRLMRE